MTDELFLFLKQCPHLNEFAMNIDYLGREAMSASLSGRCEDVLVRAYTDGDSMRKSTYRLKLRLPFGVDLETNRKNSALLEAIADWIKDVSGAGNLPELSGKRTAVSLFSETPQSPETVTADSCVYLMQVGIVYYSVR